MGIFGYGEDAFTLWALQHHLSNILGHFKDDSSPSDCVVFYRPSFGRKGGEKSAEFGEFDAIIASRSNVYLIESKWGSSSKSESGKIIIRREQELRHRIFSWYLMHWKEKYSGNWNRFAEEHKSNFEKAFPKRIATGGALVTNLEFVLTQMQKQCKNFSHEGNIKNVLLFFKKKGKESPTVSREGFDLFSIDYSEETIGNFIVLS